MFDKDKKIIFSGIQPSGDFTIANYFGAIRNWVLLQNDYNSIFCVVDLHAITVPQEPAVLRRRSIECAAMILASGIDPEKSLLFFQSSVSAHSELCWLLNCNSYMGEMARMTQYKEKSVKQGDTIRVGLFDYPVLMAADILLYNTDIVPVGDDQTQHVELARNIAERFNHNYSPTFVVPEGYYGKAGSRVMSLANPEKKMSKSDENTNAFILMKDKRDVIMNKFKRAVTDSETEVYYDKEKKKGISNLLEIYSCAKGITIPEAEAECRGMSYAEFKECVGTAVADCLDPIQVRFEALMNDKPALEKILLDSADAARSIANKTLRKVQKKIGFYQFGSK